MQEQARVLLVTRARNARRDLINGLAPLGWPLSLADSPGAALAALANSPIDAVIIDLINAPNSALAEAARLGQALKAATASRTLMVIALANPGPEVPFDGLDLIMAPPLHPIQMAARLEVLVRLATAEDEIALRAQTFAAQGQMLDQGNETDAPYRVLLIGEPGPQMLGLHNALTLSGAEVSATFNNHSGFDSLAGLKPDTVVLRAGLDVQTAVSMAMATRRNKDHFHLPIWLLLSDNDDLTPSEAFNRGLSDLAEPGADEVLIAQQVLESARLFRRISKAKAILVDSGKSELMDAATGLFTAQLFASHLLGLNKAALASHRPLSVCVLRIEERPDTARARTEGWLDKVMPHLGIMVARLVRGEDTAARLAPDLFALAMPATDAACARLAAERVAAVVGCTQFGAAQGQSAFTVGFDIGVAEVTAGESAAKALERAASLALQRRAS